MDITDEYIKMCQKAVEIQSKWEVNLGDFYTWNSAVSIISAADFKSQTNIEMRDKKIWDGKEYQHFKVGEYKEWILMHFDENKVPILQKNISKTISEFQNTYIHYKYCAWLPRQDQLQKMIKIHTISEVKKCIECCEFTDDVDDIRHTSYDNFKSLEMFWLAYVMHEIFEKSWTGSKWI